MRLPSQELILASEASQISPRTSALAGPLRSALSAAAQTGALERLTVIAAQPDALVWLRADYQNVDEASSAAPAPTAPALAAARLPVAVRTVPAELTTARARSSVRRDPTQSYLDTLEGGAAWSKGALLDVLA